MEKRHANDARQSLLLLSADTDAWSLMTKTCQRQGEQFEPERENTNVNMMSRGHHM